MSTTPKDPVRPSADRSSPARRRRAHPLLRSQPHRARDACHEQSHLSIRRGDAHARPVRDPHSELEGFARWFADWWLRRGCQLTTTHSQGGADE